MADIARVGTPTPASLLIPPSMQLTGFVAGEAIPALAPIYIKASDGKIYKATGAAANAAARQRGWAAATYALGEKGCTMLFGNFTAEYGSGLTIATDYFLSATAGELADAASTGGTTVAAYAVDTIRVRFLVPR